MAKLYTNQGWLDWDYLYNRTGAFCMVVGARGTGKTFGLLKYVVEHNIKFMYVRRLKTQLDESTTQQGNPFKSVNRAIDAGIYPKANKTSVLFLEPGPDQDAPPIVRGYGVALSTFATLRGVDYTDVECIIFDQAVPMAGQKPIKQEFPAFLNLYETVNRNRELFGRPPVKCFLLGNANKLANPYFTGWGFMGTALNMIRGGQSFWQSPDKTRIMVMMVDSPISERKRTTALYKNSSASFDKMALSNTFTTDPTRVKSRPLQQYNHICSVGQIGFYKHKSKSEIYVSRKTQRANYYNPYGMQLEMWRNRYVLFKSLYFSQMLTFESFDTQLIFRELTL